MQVGGLGNDLASLIRALAVNAGRSRCEGRTFAPSIDNGLLLGILHAIGEHCLVFRLHNLVSTAATSCGRVVVIPHLWCIHVEGKQITRLMADIVR